METSVGWETGVSYMVQIAWAKLPGEKVRIEYARMQGKETEELTLVPGAPLVANPAFSRDQLTSVRGKVNATGIPIALTAASGFFRIRAQLAR